MAAIVKVSAVLMCSFLCSFLPVHCANQFNMTAYKMMPRVFYFDDYDECLHDDPSVPNVYCVVKAVIEPNVSSPIWNEIVDYSSNWKQHFNHAHLERGLCLNNCLRTLATLERNNVTAQELTSLVVPKFEIDFRYTFPQGTFRDIDEYRRNYSEMMGKCVNIELTRKYRLRAYTEIEYCRSNTILYPADWLDKTFVVVALTLVGIVIVSSWYDFRCKSTHGLEHYKQDLPTTGSMCLVSFSIIRNWYRINTRANDQLSQELRYIHLFRVLIFMGITLGHIGFLEQPRIALTIEKRYNDIRSMLLMNGSSIVTTFFAISAFLQVIYFTQKVEQTKKKVGIVEIFIIAAIRYIRLTPAMGFMILFEATWMARLGDGPLWLKGIETGRSNCRRNWWTNLLYINNYYNTEQPCLMHTWYLAADFHLFIYGLVLCTLISRFPKIRNLLLGTMMFLSFVGTAAIIFVQEYDAIPLFPLEHIRYFFVYWRGYKDTYIASHTYLVNYTSAIIYSFCYMHLSKTKTNYHWTFKVFWFIGFFMIPLLFAVCFVFYNYRFTTPSVWMALLFPFIRTFYSTLVFLGAIGLSFRFIKTATRFFSIQFFTVLGRLTYSAYLCHMFLLKKSIFSTRSMHRYDMIEGRDIWAATILLSYILGCFLCLMIESPLIALQSQLSKHHTRTASDTTDQSKNGKDHVTHIGDRNEKSCQPSIVSSQRM